MLFRSKLSDGLTASLERAIQYNYRERFKNAQEMLDELNAVLLPQGVPVPQPEPNKPLPIEVFPPTIQQTETVTPPLDEVATSAESTHATDPQETIFAGRVNNNEGKTERPQPPPRVQTQYRKEVVTKQAKPDKTVDKNIANVSSPPPVDAKYRKHVITRPLKYEKPDDRNVSPLPNGAKPDDHVAAERAKVERPTIASLIKRYFLFSNYSHQPERARFTIYLFFLSTFFFALVKPHALKGRELFVLGYFIWGLFRFFQCLKALFDQRNYTDPRIRGLNKSVHYIAVLIYVIGGYFISLVLGFLIAKNISVNGADFLFFGVMYPLISMLVVDEARWVCLYLYKNSKR